MRDGISAESTAMQTKAAASKFCTPETCAHVLRPKTAGETAAAKIPAVIYVETGHAWTFRLDRPTGATRALTHRAPVYGCVVRPANSPAEVRITCGHSALGIAPARVAAEIISADASDTLVELSGAFSAQLELFDQGDGPTTVTLSHRVAVDSSALTRLYLDAPPMLGDAVGYRGDSRFLALHWEHDADALAYTDGSQTGYGDWINWLAFAEHKHVAPRLAPYDIGDRGADASHWLLLDQESASLYAGRAEDVRRFVITAATLRQSKHPAPADYRPDTVTTFNPQDEPAPTDGALRAWLDEALANEAAARAGVTIEGVVLRTAYLIADPLKPHRHETAGCLAIVSADAVRLIDFELRGPEASRIYHGHSGSPIRLKGDFSSDARTGRRQLFIAAGVERLDREVPREDVFILEALTDTVDALTEEIPRASIKVTRRVPSADEVALLYRSYDFRLSENRGHLIVERDVLNALGLSEVLRSRAEQDGVAYALEQDVEAPMFVNALAASLGMTRAEVWSQLITVRELAPC